jgi:chloramphenicol-sensitive protein RarD
MSSLASPSDPAAQPVRAGALFGVSAYIVWGLLPFFLKLLSSVPALQILAHRVLWSLALLVAAAFLLGRWKPIIEALRNRRALRLLCLSAALIAVNWIVYIWAVLNGHVLAASLGYFINPLVNVALGVVVLGERLRRLQTLAVLLAGVGVAVLALAGGVGLPIALTLALSFGCYGLVRKVAPVDAFAGLLIETAWLAPLAMGWLLWLGPQGVFGRDHGQDALLMASGIVTAVPLLLFAAAAKRMRYATLGLFQYIAPTLQFLQAVLMFGEPLRPAHIFTFACIWAGLALYAFDSLRGGAATPVTAD